MPLSLAMFRQPLARLGSMPSHEDIASALLRLAAIRPQTFCPSEAARALAKDWRPLMPQLRDIAFALQDRGELEILQNGQRVTSGCKGPIRIRAPAK